MQVLITGGTGILGSATGRLLADRGHTVRLLDVAPDPAASPPHDAVEIVQGDVMSFGDLGDAMRDVEVVVHLAYSLGEATNRRPYAATRLNVEGTARSLESARLSGVGRVLLASSVAVYGSDDMYEPGELPLTEDAATRLAPGMPLYGAGKLYLERLAEVYRKTHGLLGVGLRPSPVYGPGGVRGVSGWLSGVMARAAAGWRTVDPIGLVRPAGARAGPSPGRPRCAGPRRSRCPGARRASRRPPCASPTRAPIRGRPSAHRAPIPPTAGPGPRRGSAR